MKGIKIFLCGVAVSRCYTFFIFIIIKSGGTYKAVANHEWSRRGLQFFFS